MFILVAKNLNITKQHIRIFNLKAPNNVFSIIVFLGLATQKTHS